MSPQHQPLKSRAGTGQGVRSSETQRVREAGPAAGGHVRSPGGHRLTVVGSCGCQKDVSVPRFKTKQVLAGVGRGSRKPGLSSEERTEADQAGHRPQGRVHGAPQGGRGLATPPPKSVAQHGAGNPFLSLFPKSHLKSQDRGKATETGRREGPAVGFGVDVVCSWQGLKRQPSDIWGSVVRSRREDPSEGTLAGPARLRHRDSTPRSLPPLPSGPLAPGRFNGVIYSRERPLSGPAK